MYMSDHLMAQGDGAMAQVSRRLAQVDRRLAQVDGNLAQVDGNLAQVPKKGGDLRHRKNPNTLLSTSYQNTLAQDLNKKSHLRQNQSLG